MTEVWKRTKRGFQKEPLKKNAEILVVRTTMLESFNSCPYMYKHDGEIIRASESGLVPHQGKMAYRLGEIFEQGTILHKVGFNLINAYFYAKDHGGDEMEAVNKTMMDSLKMLNANPYKYDAGSLGKSLQLFARNLHVFEGLTFDPILSELGMSILFEDGDVGVALSGTPDYIFYQGDDNETLHLFDLKTSKNKRHPVDTEKGKKEYIDRIQRRSYPVITSFYIPHKLEDEYEFQYFPITKQVTPQVTHDFIIRNTFQDAQVFLINLVNRYIEAYAEQNFPARRYINREQNKTCFRCPLKKYGACPAWQKEGF